MFRIYSKKPELGEKRIVRTYCTLPKKIDGYWYWLEHINIIQCYMNMSLTSGRITNPKWVNVTVI